MDPDVGNDALDFKIAVMEEDYEDEDDDKGE